jgi:hypothetical protein
LWLSRYAGLSATTFSTQLPQGNASLQYQLTICVKVSDAVGSCSYAFSQIQVFPADPNVFNVSVNTQISNTISYYSQLNNVGDFVSVTIPILDEFIHNGPGKIPFTW